MRIDTFESYSRKNIVARQVRVRAHFSYKAADDPYIPCKEAGLDFTNGDVLHIVSQDDAYWYDIDRLSLCSHLAASRSNLRFETGGKPDGRAIET